MANKTTTLLLALCAIALTGCVGEAGKVNTNQYELNSYEDAILSAEYNGHKYIIYKGRYNGGITHDPDCPCHQKGGEDENAF